MQNTAKQDEAWVRSIAALAVIGLHALLLVELGRLRRAVYEVEDGASRAMTLLIVPEISPDDREPTDEVRKRKPPSSPTRERIATIREPRSNLEVKPDQQPAINWRANAARSAQRVVEESAVERYRSFGPREELDTSIKAPPSVFPQPKHRAGEVGEDSYGDPALWLSDNCFQELDKPVPTARDIFTIVPLVKCVIKIGKRPANGRLFEHIKKPEEPPAPAAGTEMNSLPREIQPGEVFER